ncbi:MAG: ATP-dependent DNA helicase RecG, partial [Oscillospiraceae bacterium]|nr:ATP-dependent DNA helicase RecG [Oscillospiraceae bacterium]
MADLDTNVQYIAGVGPARAKSFLKLGVQTLRDLVSYFPRAYEDRSVFRRINDLKPGETVCVRATVASSPVLSHIRRGLDIVRARVVDEAGSMNIAFFNQPYVRNTLVPGKSYVFYGRVGGTLIAPEMTNPVFEPEGTDTLTGRIIPVYPLTAGLSQNVLIKCVSQGLALCGDELPDTLPEEIRRDYGLAQARFAYENVHFPADSGELSIARKRLVFEELFLLSCAMVSLRSRIDEKRGEKLPEKDAEAF